MIKTTFYIILICLCNMGASAQRVRIESCGCDFKVDPEVMKTMPANVRQYNQSPALPDSSFKKQCGYLIVPENRKKKNSKLIKLPFIIVRSKNPNKRPDPVLFTSGGPGSSSLGNAVAMSKGPFIEHRDCIAFEQRGTNFALPNLRTLELDIALKEAYRKNLNKDSMTLVGLKKYKSALEKRGIDLTGYNSDETVSDIHDLLNELKIDSVNLYGGSYSGGLMTAVLQRDPTRIRSLILDSPLPAFVPIDEDEPANFMEALCIYFKHVAVDSAGKGPYDHLSERFDRYFTSITGKIFQLPFLEPGTSDSIRINYSKNELLSVVLDKLYDEAGRKHLARIITELIAGKHQPYMLDYFNGFFRKNAAPNGMRISVYCADQAAYHSEQVRKELNAVYPYLAGFHINDVYQAMCDCWKMPPLNPKTKLPFYSDKPVLLADGEMDPACRPLYIDRISHYMPNSQRFLVLNKGHGVMGKAMTAIASAFLDDPYKKIVSDNKSIIAY
jgi:pimeloyl-ACP methyl ester carboxylesterase